MAYSNLRDRKRIEAEAEKNRQLAEQLKREREELQRQAAEMKAAQQQPTPPQEQKQPTVIVKNSQSCLGEGCLVVILIIALIVMFVGSIVGC